MDKNNVKIFVCVISIIIVLGVMISFVFTRINNRKNIFLDNIDNEFLYEYFVLCGQDFVGVIDKNGQTLIETKYSEIDIPNPSKDVFFCFSENGDCIVLNKDNNQLFKDYNVSTISIENETIEFEANVLKYEKNGLYGLIDLDGNVLTEPKFSSISSLNEKPNVLLVKLNNKYGVLNQKGEEIIPIEYDSIVSDQYCTEENVYSKTGYIVSKKSDSGEEFGYIDYNGNVIVEPKYESIKRAMVNSDKKIYLIVMQNGKKGILRNAKKLIDLNFQDIQYSNNIFVVNKNGKYGFYNIDGKVILKPIYKEYEIVGNYISVKENDEVKIYDINGNNINSNKYKEMYETSNENYFIGKNNDGYYNIISKDVKIEDRFTNIQYAFNDYFVVEKNDKVGVIDAKTNETVVDFEYDYAFKIDGFNIIEAVKLGENKTDLYSKKLEKILTSDNVIVNSINKEYAIIYSNSDIKYVNIDGEFVSNKEVYKDKTLYAIKENNLWGFSDVNGNKVIDCIYDVALELNDYGFASVKKDGKWGVIDSNGNIVVNTIYDLEDYNFPQFIGKYLLIEHETLYCEVIE